MHSLDPAVVLPIKKAIDTLESLLFSPVIGFMLAFGAMHFLHIMVRNKDFFKHPGLWWNKYPKPWIKYSLITSSAFVSFAHGSNDGQK
jgi:phosphate/sulfate permease